MCIREIWHSSALSPVLHTYACRFRKLIMYNVPSRTLHVFDRKGARELSALSHYTNVMSSCIPQSLLQSMCSELVQLERPGL